jgi:hypothetical protein
MKPRSKASKRSKATRSKDSQDVEMASIDDTTTDDQRDGDQPAVSNRRGSVVQAATTGRSPEFVLPDQCPIEKDKDFRWNIRHRVKATLLANLHQARYLTAQKLLQLDKAMLTEIASCFKETFDKVKCILTG